MNQIGFIGLGTMGLPMAENLLNTGYELIVCNRTASKTDRLKNKGAKVAASPAEVASQSDVLITILTADQAVEEVILGENGVLSGASQGLIVIDSSTISPKTSMKVAERLAAKGIEMLDAPVTGSEPQAIEGILTFMVGGKKAIFDRCMPLFKAMGKNAFYMGQAGAGSYTKLANNSLAAINLLALSESLVMATKSGIDPELFIQVVSGGGARSGMIDTKAAKMIHHDFSPNFKTALMHKDLGLAANLAADLEIPVPVLSLVKQMLQLAIAKGFADEDMCSIVKCYEEWAGVNISESM